MELTQLIQKAFDVFSDDKKPLQCTNHLDFEEAGFNDMLLSATRGDLTIEQAGTIAWSPIPSMTPQALAYFMPRFIELAVTHGVDRDGDLFFCHFINSFSNGPQDERFRGFGPEQKEVMADTFDFLCQNFHNELKAEGWFEDACEGVRNWGKIAVK
jgi:hypothetical protein